MRRHPMHLLLRRARAAAGPALAAIIAAWAAACGDPLVDAAWRGEPLFTLEGFVHLAIPPEQYLDLETREPGELRTAIFWAPTRGSSLSLSSAVEQDVRTASTFPARFTLTIHEPPLPALLRPDPETGALFAVGLVVAYRDTNGNGRWDRASERLIGGAADRFVLHAPDGLDNSLFGRLEPGFHRVVPVARCEGERGVLAYDLDPSPTMTLLVGAGFPAEVFLPLDCAGGGIGWSGACPPLFDVRARCGGDPGALEGDARMCAACVGLLAPPLGDAGECNAWGEACLQRFPAEECRAEVAHCLGDPAPPPPPPDGCDRLCECQRVFEQCLDANPGRPDACRGRLDQCLSTR